MSKTQVNSSERNKCNKFTLETPWIVHLKTPRLLFFYFLLPGYFQNFTWNPSKYCFTLLIFICLNWKVLTFPQLLHFPCVKTVKTGKKKKKSFVFDLFVQISEECSYFTCCFCLNLLVTWIHFPFISNSWPKITF